MNAIIVDDEEKSRNTLRNFLARYCPDIHLIDEADGVETGFAAVRKHQPDAVFLDVEMKDGTGFDLLNLLKPVNFKVIFITAFNSYALKAFDFSAVDYLLKPLDPARLVEAVNKLKNNTQNDFINKKLEALLENKKSLEKIALPESDGLVMIKIKDIIRCESESNYTRFYLRDGKTHLSTRTLKDYDEMFSGLNFCRIHKSHLINTDFVSRYIKGEGGSIVMDDNTELEVARRRKDDLLLMLKKA